MACGHTLDDLVAGADTVTFCGACQMAKRAGQPYGVRPVTLHSLADTFDS